MVVCLIKLLLVLVFYGSFDNISITIYSNNCDIYIAFIFKMSDLIICAGVL